MDKKEIESTMKLVIKITDQLGFPITSDDYYIEDTGCPHERPSLPEGYAAVYLFWYEPYHQFLKIGKANVNTKTRFRYLHYGFNSNSTLANSICNDPDFQKKGINKENVKDWMLNNLQRLSIFIKANNGKERAVTELVESIFHYKYRPCYEGNI